MGCQHQGGDIYEFFRHENHLFPVALSDNEHPHILTDKSEILDHLEGLVSNTCDSDYLHNTSGQIDMVIIDGAAMVGTYNGRKI